MTKYTDQQIDAGVMALGFAESHSQEDLVVLIHDQMNAAAQHPTQLDRIESKLDLLITLLSEDEPQPSDIASLDGRTVGRERNDSQPL